jgi:hypothetical protein
VARPGRQLYVTNVAWIPLTRALNTYVVRPGVAGGYQQRQSATVALRVWQRIFLAKK